MEMATKYEVMVAIAGVFAALAIIISVSLIYSHLRSYINNNVQRHIIRILWMVPLYALVSWLSLRFRSSALYFDTIRDVYEAYVLYSFFSLLQVYVSIATDLPVEDALESKGTTVSQPPPFCFLPPIKPSRRFLIWIRRGILQFVVVKPILAFATLLLEKYGVYGEDILQFNKGYIYIAFFNNISISISLYCLILFYFATEEILAPFNPLPQFLCIKSIVFFTFWQGLMWVGLVKLGYIKQAGNFDPNEIASINQNSLICLEMMLLAIAHNYVFQTKAVVGMVEERERDRDREIEENPPDVPEEFNAQSTANRGMKGMKPLLDVVDVSDVVKDLESSLKPAKDHTKDM